MTDTIKFANGICYECSYLATDGQGTAWIILDGLDIAESVAVFSNSDMTERMEWGDYILTGYTNLVFVMVDNNGVKCGLKGGHDERRT